MYPPKYDESRLVDEFHDCNNKTNSKGMFNRLSQEHKSVFGWKSYASYFQMKVCMSRQVSSMDVIHRYGQNLIYGWTNPSKRMGSHISHRVFRLSKPCRFKILMAEAIYVEFALFSIIISHKTWNVAIR